MKKSFKICRFRSGKSVGLSIIAYLVCGGWWKAEGHCAPTQKSVINWIWLLLSVSDRPIIMIGPGGLLSVVPHLFAVPVSVYCRGCKKANNETWMWKILLQGCILSTAGDPLIRGDAPNTPYVGLDDSYQIQNDVQIIYTSTTPIDTNSWTM
jgi:hypothetical protein